MGLLAGPDESDGFDENGEFDEISPRVMTKSVVETSWEKLMSALMHEKDSLQKGPKPQKIIFFLGSWFQFYPASNNFHICLDSLGIRTISGSNTFVVYEIWANSEDLNR